MTEETTTGVHRLYQMQKDGRLLFPAINVNDSVTKSKFDNLYGCRESLVDGIRRGTDAMMAGKVAMVAGFGDVGKGSAASLRNAGCRVMIAEIDPICALQAAMEGYEVTTMDDAAPRADIFVTATGNVDVITIEHMRRMKDRAIVANIGHFDSEIQVGALQEPQMAQREAAGGRDRVPGRQAHHSPVARAPGESRQRHGPSELRDERVLHQSGAGADRAVRKPGKYEKKVYTLPKHLDEKVARLHLGKIGVKLTTLTDKQATYIGVPQAGPVQAGSLPVLRREAGVGEVGADHERNAGIDVEEVLQAHDLEEGDLRLGGRNSKSDRPRSSCDHPNRVTTIGISPPDHTLWPTHDRKTDPERDQPDDQQQRTVIDQRASPFR